MFNFESERRVVAFNLFSQIYNSFRLNCQNKFQFFIILKKSSVFALETRLLQRKKWKSVKTTFFGFVNFVGHLCIMNF